MDIEKELEKQWKHVNVYGSIAIFNNMKWIIQELVKEYEGQLNTAENELIELRAYKEAAEKKEEEKKSMKISGNNYCLGYGLSDKCESCQNAKNWIELNEMPDNWRKNAQRSMQRVDESECGIYGGIFYKSS